MSDIFVPPNDREVFEHQFIEIHSALGVKATSNSGAYWGDGDARPEAARQGGLTFAVEMKTRQSERLTPKPSEYVKACGEPGGEDGQLHKFDGQAIRLFAVFSLESETYAVSTPQVDWKRLVAETSVGEDVGQRKELRRRSGPNLSYRFFEWTDWKDLYDAISNHTDS